MIKNITSTSKYIQCTCTGSPGSTWISSGSGSQGVGNMRYNTLSQNIEIYDGNVWVTMQNGYVDVGLTSEAASIMEWARKKRNEEIERDLLAATNPIVKDLIKQIEEKEEQIKVVQTLIKKEVSHSV